MSLCIAKQLKEAGFPQSADWFFNAETKNRDSWYDLGETTPNSDEYIACPSLSELIEACGYDFDTLRNTGRRWEAGLWQEDGIPNPAVGKTPDEAVARLWLALHSKAK